MTPKPPVNARVLGLQLGAANVAIAALCAAIAVHPVAFVAVIAAGMLPGVVAGVLSGCLMESACFMAPPLRRAIVLVLPLALVVVLGATFDVTELTVVASIPTVVLALVLEQMTRPRPPIPVAIASRACRRAD